MGYGAQKKVFFGQSPPLTTGGGAVAPAVANRGAPSQHPPAVTSVTTHDTAVAITHPVLVTTTIHPTNNTANASAVITLHHYHHL